MTGMNSLHDVSTLKRDSYYLKHNLFVSFCSVFDVDDDTVPSQFRNGFTFLNPDEKVSR